MSQKVGTLIGLFEDSEGLFNKLVEQANKLIAIKERVGFHCNLALREERYDDDTLKNFQVIKTAAEHALEETNRLGAMIRDRFGEAFVSFRSRIEQR